MPVVAVVGVGVRHTLMELVEQVAVETA